MEASTASGRAVGAIGFRNSATDSPADQRWVNAKFQADLKAASSKAGTFSHFVFFTNVRLTVGAKQKLLTLGRAVTTASVAIFDREQMRLTLDSPEGLAARYQFLQIPLSEAEQTAFFARWGADLESLVTKSFAAVEERLQRLEFLHERERALTTLAFHIRLVEPQRIDQLPHVRSFVSIWKLSRNLLRSQWNVGVCNNSPLRNDGSCGETSCLIGRFWLNGPTDVHASSVSSLISPFSVVGGHGGFNEFSDARYVATLGDLDGAFFSFFMNRRVANVISSIHLFANEYLLWSGVAEDLDIDSPATEPESPFALSEEELADPWVRVRPKGSAGHIHFSSVTPLRMWNAPKLEPTTS